MVKHLFRKQDSCEFESHRSLLLDIYVYLCYLKYMRNPDRIPEMLRMLGLIWEVIPDQRLGQLVVNLTRTQDGSIRDPWTVEDDELEEIMRDTCDINNLGA